MTNNPTREQKAIAPSGQREAIALSTLSIGIAWCLAWGNQRQPQFELATLHQMRQALKDGTEVPEEVKVLVEQVRQLDNLKFPNTLDELKQLTEQHPILWNSKIGLVYGGATKIKQYVFEAAKLPDIRGASGLLDQINLIDLPAFFKCEESSDFPECHRAKNYCQNIRQELQDKDEKLQQLWEALIPELVIYSTGGNILAFCPTAFVHDLANLIERRYTEETLTANSCAVGDTFRVLEIRFGLLNDPIEQTKWLDWYLEDENKTHRITEAYFGRPEDGQNWEELFKNRKNFNEVTGKLAALFQKRRNGNDLPDVERPSRRYPPMFETHPYLVRDEGQHRIAIAPAIGLPDNPWFSDAIARKRIVGQRTKREDSSGQGWYQAAQFGWQSGQVKKVWQPGKVVSWVFKFEQFLKDSDCQNEYYQSVSRQKVKEARSLTEIGNASNGFVGYIYADGNNMGGYIQKQLKTPEDYRRFSRDIFTATEESVYKALEQHLHPHELKGLTGEHQHRNGAIIHPFEILTIGGDDVMLIVPADKALAIAKTIGEEFERRLATSENYKVHYPSCLYHRYRPETAELAQCQLSMSTGVLITALATPIYYAEELAEQLLKSAKKRAKDLKKHGYYGGTVDFMVMKSVTMISSNIGEFRKEGLTKQPPKQPILKLYGAPYTLHELEGLLKTAEALKQSEFPRSQLYQIRSLLEQGKHTAILNYRYFRTRLKPENQKLLKEKFEETWCEAKTNDGNLAPWMSLLEEDSTTTYETIWRELVDLYPFIQELEQQENQQYSEAERQA
ncbi:MAG TPA: type III-B CRISPR-associated protein Cas10/Cmr2 [Cyanobacteria bacterium UBA11162]|nr:type III-B CRISPR-associated protein Cas10/Cmr2 [Cyanobacteria bacterium UBA11162]